MKEYPISNTHVVKISFRNCEMNASRFALVLNIVTEIVSWIHNLIKSVNIFKYVTSSAKRDLIAEETVSS